MKVPIPAPEPEDYVSEVTLGHHFNGNRCIYCGWAYYQSGADEPCTSERDEHVGVWTFEEGRNDMVAYEQAVDAAYDAGASGYDWRYYRD